MQVIDVVIITFIIELDGSISSLLINGRQAFMIWHVSLLYHILPNLMERGSAIRVLWFSVKGITSHFHSYVFAFFFLFICLAVLIQTIQSLRSLTHKVVCRILKVLQLVFLISKRIVWCYSLWTLVLFVNHLYFTTEEPTLTLLSSHFTNVVRVEAHIL